MTKPLDLGGGEPLVADAVQSVNAGVHLDVLHSFEVEFSATVVLPPQLEHSCGIAGKRH